MAVWGRVNRLGSKFRNLFQQKRHGSGPAKKPDRTQEEISKYIQEENAKVRSFFQYTDNSVNGIIFQEGYLFMKRFTTTQSITDKA